MKKLIIVAILVTCMLAMSCATITVPVAATGEPLGPLVGQASGRIWLYAFGTADAGIRAAAQNGGITTVTSVDMTTKLGILGLWMDFEVTVTGR